MSTLKPSVSTQDHIQGETSAGIELVEYGDYECPHCGYAYSIIKEIQHTFGDQIKFIFRNFPLSESHPNAFPAALAAEAAALQGKFWEMHDGIYENQHEIGDVVFLRLAKQMGLDLDKFNSDVQSSELRKRIEADFESGIRSGVNGTPSFYINGQKFDGGADDLFEMLKDSAE